jgi:hypothetical protein
MNRHLLVVGTLFVCGCGGPPATLPVDTGHMKSLGIIYAKYVGEHGGHRPPSEEALRQYASSGGGLLLKQFGIDDPAKLFVSPRDGRPLLVPYGTDLVTEDRPLAGYESEPTDGRRWVVWTTGSVMLVDESEFQRIKPAR